MKTSTAIAVLGGLAFVLVAGWWVYGNKVPAQAPAQNTTEPFAKAAFVCSLGQAIGVTFIDKGVTVVLSDGRTLTLAQTESASGTRYANTDESFVFWGKGNTAFITEGAAQNQTYNGCILVAPDTSGALSQIYATSSDMGFTLRFPQNYTVDQKHTYASAPGKITRGVKFTVPKAATLGTNLSADTYLSVEVAPQANMCSADLFLTSTKTIPFTDNGITYSVATSSGVAAGNIYDEAVFAIPGSSPCTAVRYMVHSTNSGNYEPGTIKEFDKVGVINEFDNIRRSLVLGR